MGKQQFHFNPLTQRFEPLTVSWRARLIRAVLFTVLTLSVAAGFRVLIRGTVSNPKEIKLQAEKEALLHQYSVSEARIAALEQSIQQYRQHDDEIYRPFYQLEPLPEFLHQAGLGGSERYANLRGFRHSNLMIGLTQRVELAELHLDIQSNSYNELLHEAEQHRELLDHKPSIQPVSLNDFYWISSVFGYRTDPMSRRRTMHYGLDFAAAIGTPVYATGDGVVRNTEVSRRGFGRFVVIDHGFGYSTLYGHLDDILVQRGQQIKRGCLIGTMGNSGKSTGPHLHYEVRMHGRALNPKHFYAEDLSGPEFEAILSQAATSE